MDSLDLIFEIGYGKLLGEPKRWPVSGSVWQRERRVSIINETCTIILDFLVKSSALSSHSCESKGRRFRRQCRGI